MCAKQARNRNSKHGGTRRLNIMIREDQYQKLLTENINLSGLFRDLLDDRVSDSRIVLSVSPQAKKLYDVLISNFGITDPDLEPYFLEALDDVLEKRTTEIETLQAEIRQKSRKQKQGR